ncbi:uncharacterized protein LOC130360490 [Hyla sarda]|uniref:uncharacterized protein LOC130360490 n=1 Tax=Hyla sarda TaxID=327740 RepID=UPI0024C26014|nr:uncharacterized protein LOC130360490 [Hyla sarda]
MRHMILAALCMWSCIMTVTPLLTEEQIGRATNYIQQHLTKDFNYQYSYFVKFTEEECNRGLTYDILHKALKGENADTIYQQVDDYHIYEGKRMVVSSYDTFEKSNKKHTLHPEYRLLNPDFHSPISRLLTDGLFAGCSIFYTFFSPCTSKCSLPDGNYNIIDKLSTIVGLPKDRVFIFKQVYQRDTKQPSMVVWDSWKSLNNYIRLLRCSENNCVQCFKNDIPQYHCYTGSQQSKTLDF